MKGPTLLLDADIIAFKLAATAQRSYRFDPDGPPAVALEEPETLRPRVAEAVNDLCKKLETTEVIVCLSCPTAENWRLKVLPSYKGNRDYSQRPEYLQAVKDILEEDYPSYRRPTLEADDIMGILSTHPELVEGKKVIVSEDKDMKTIPGWLFNPAKDKSPRLIIEEEADWWHLYQTLVGDTTDGYKGCPGLGPKRAEKLMGPVGSNLLDLWPLIVAVFESKGLTEQDALVQARVARICRASDYDFTNKEVLLWTP